MKLHIPLLFLVALAGAAPSSPPTTKKVPLRLVSGPGYSGAIFPAERGREALILIAPGERISGFWTPTPELIADLERELRYVMTVAAGDAQRVLGRENSTPEYRAYVEGEIGEIVEHYDEYRHQYVGIVINGKRRVFVNSFSAHDSPDREAHPYWRDAFVDVDDGGFWYWRIHYDPDTKTFSRFSSNGYA